MSSSAGPRAVDRAGRPARATQASAAAKVAVRHPAWVIDYVRAALRRKRAGDRRFDLLEYRDYFVSEAAAVAAAAVVEVDYPKLCSELSVDDRREPTGRQPSFEARPSLVRIAAAIARLVRPSTVIETGVARGRTTAAILSELERNRHGHLYSVDLPPLGVDPAGYVGELVPEALRARWTLLLGPSRRFLKPLAGDLAPIDLFLHDSDHSYETQLEEYLTVWPHLRAGGILLSDDVCNPALLEVSAEVGVRPYLVGEPRDPNVIGLLVKPPSRAPRSAS